MHLRAMKAYLYKTGKTGMRVYYKRQTLPLRFASSPFVAVLTSSVNRFSEKIPRAPLFFRCI